MDRFLTGMDASEIVKGIPNAILINDVTIDNRGRIYIPSRDKRWHGIREGEVFDVILVKPNGDFNGLTVEKCIAFLKARGYSVMSPFFRRGKK